MRCVKAIDDLRAVFMGTRNQYLPASQSKQPLRAFTQIVRTRGQEPRFAAVRREQRHQGQQVSADRIQKRRIREGGPAARRQHGIQDDRRGGDLLQDPGQGERNLLASEQANLDYGHGNIIQYRPDLGQDLVYRLEVQAGDIAAVLYRETGDRRACVAAVCGYRLDVGLDAGPAHRVMAGNAQDDRGRVGIHRKQYWGAGHKLGSDCAIIWQTTSLGRLFQ